MRIYARVTPRSCCNMVEKISTNEYKIKTTVVPEKGKANKMVIKLLAKYFAVSKSEITIVGGKTSRTKIIDIG